MPRARRHRGRGGFGLSATPISESEMREATQEQLERQDRRPGVALSEVLASRLNPDQVALALDAYAQHGIGRLRHTLRFSLSEADPGLTLNCSFGDFTTRRKRGHDRRSHARYARDKSTQLLAVGSEIGLRPLPLVDRDGVVIQPAMFPHEVALAAAHQSEKLARRAMQNKLNREAEASGDPRRYSFSEHDARAWRRSKAIGEALDCLTYLRDQRGYAAAAITITLPPSWHPSGRDFGVRSSPKLGGLPKPACPTVDEAADALRQIFNQALPKNRGKLAGFWVLQDHDSRVPHLHGIISAPSDELRSIQLRLTRSYEGLTLASRCCGFRWPFRPDPVSPKATHFALLSDPGALEREIIYCLRELADPLRMTSALQGQAFAKFGLFRGWAAPTPNATLARALSQLGDFARLTTHAASVDVELHTLHTPHPTPTPTPTPSPRKEAKRAANGPGNFISKNHQEGGHTPAAHLRPWVRGPPQNLCAAPQEWLQNGAAATNRSPE